jgi:hypothetical protein
MGRYSGSAGAGGAGGTQEIINAVLPAGEPVQRGDLVLVGTDGKGYVAALPSDTPLALALRPTSGGPQLENYQMASALASIDSSGGSGEDSFEVIKLANGNILMACTTVAKSPIFSLLDQDGKVLVLMKQISAAAANGSQGRNVSAVALANGGFAIAYTAAANVFLSVHDRLGNAVMQFQVGPSDQQAVRIALLANGDIAVVSTSINTMYYSVYKVDGTQIRAATALLNVSGGSYHGRTMAVAGLTGGGFVIGYIQPLSSSISTAYRVFDNAGVAVSPNATGIWPQSGTSGGFCYIVALSNGGFAFAALATTVGLHLAIGTAQGTTKTIINLGSIVNTTYGNGMALAAAPNGNVGITYVAPSGVLIGLYNSAGETVSAPRVLDPADSNQSCGLLSFNDDNSAYAATTGTSSTSGKIFCLDAQAKTTSVWRHAIAQGIGSWPCTKVIGVTNSKSDVPCYMMFYQEPTGGAIRMVSNFSVRQPMTLIGVATNNVAKNGEIGVQMTGSAILRRGFVLPWSVNQQTSNPPGQRMYAMGSTAVMSGIQAPAPNSIT